MIDDVYTPARWKKMNSLAKPFEHATQIFAHISEQQKTVIRLNARVKPLFQTHASMDVTVAHYDNGQLTIAANSLTAANHLYYLHSMFFDILKQLPELQDMTKLSFIYITEPAPKKPTSVKFDRQINDESRKLLKKTAGIIKDNPQLSQALYQLSGQNECD